MTIKLDRSAMTKNLVRKFKLVPHVDRVLAEGEFEWEYKHEPKKGDDGWHPSGDCIPSIHDLWLKATGQAEYRPISGSLYKTFQVGHFWHQYLQFVVQDKLGFCGHDAIERRGKRSWGELVRTLVDPISDNTHGLVLAYPMDPPNQQWARPKPYHWATGAGDIAPCSIPEHGDYIVDFKTMNERDFRNENLPEWVRKKYEAQINIYMDFFDQEKGLIVAIQKDSPHDMKEFEYERNQPLIDAIYEKWHLVSLCLAEGIEPPVDEDIDLDHLFRGQINS